MEESKRSLSSKVSRKCHCGKAIVMRTSWTNWNPGRRFLGCEKYGVNGGCGYFSWHDPPMCERSTHVIPGLLRKVRKIEGENESHKKKEKMLYAALLVSWVIVVGLLMNKI